MSILTSSPSIAVVFVFALVGTTSVPKRQSLHKETGKKWLKHTDHECDPSPPKGRPWIHLPICRTASIHPSYAPTPPPRSL